MKTSIQRMEQLAAHGPPTKRPLAELSYGELLQSVTQKALLLAKNESTLVQIELQDEIISEILLTRRIIIGVGMVVAGACMLLMAVVFACAQFISPWLSACALGFLILSAGFALIVVTWRRYRTVDEIQSELKEKLAWSKKTAA